MVKLIDAPHHLFTKFIHLIKSHGSPWRLYVDIPSSDQLELFAALADIIDFVRCAVDGGRGKRQTLILSIATSSRVEKFSSKIFARNWKLTFHVTRGNFWVSIWLQKATNRQWVSISSSLNLLWRWVFQFSFPLRTLSCE